METNIVEVEDTIIKEEKVDIEVEENEITKEERVDENCIQVEKNAIKTEEKVEENCIEVEESPIKKEESVSENCIEVVEDAIKKEKKVDENCIQVEDAIEGEEKIDESGAELATEIVKAEPQQPRSKYKACLVVLPWVFCIAIILIVVVVARRSEGEISYFSDSTAPNTAPHLSRRLKNHDGKSNDVPCDVCTETANEILSSLNTSVNPCDNFYDFACQGWETENPVPDNWRLAKWSPIEKLKLKSIEMVVEILNERIDVFSDIPALVQAKEYYRKCVDSYKLEIHGIFQDKKTMQQILDTLEEYGGWPILYQKGQWNSSRFDILKSIVALRRKFDAHEILNIVVVQSSPEYEMSNKIVLYRPSYPFIVSTEPEKDGLRNMLAYKAFIMDISRELLRFTGRTDIDETYLEKQANDLLRVYTELQTAAEKTTNENILVFPNNFAYFSLDKLQNLLEQHIEPPFKNQMDLLKLFQLLFANTNIQIRAMEEILVADLNYFLGVSMLLSESDQEAIANYLHLQILFKLLDLLPSVKLRGYFERLMYSLGQMRNYTKLDYNQLCASRVMNIFIFAVGHKYVEKRVKSSSSTFSLGKEIDQVGHLFNSMRLSFSQLMASSKQIDNSKKLKLRENLFSAALCSGYPSWILDKDRVQTEYADLVLQGSNYFEQTLALNEWKTIESLKELEQQAQEKCDWKEFPGSVFAHIFNQVIYISSGLLWAPLYHSNLPKSIIFGKLGSILGHELAHSVHQLFDDGWTTIDGGRETKLSKCLIEYYSNFTFDELKNEHVNLDGNLTMRENFADETGIRTAYTEFKVNRYFKSGKLEGLENYSGEQLFFIGYAQSYCMSSDLNHKRSLLNGKKHSPPRFRVLGPLTNFEEFAKVWKCPVGSKMNPKPTHKPETCQVF